MQIHRVGLAVTILGVAPLVAASGQAVLAPSKRVLVVCDALKEQMGDLTKMIPSVQNADERAGVTQLASVAELNAERCLSIHSLLFAYEIVSVGEDKQKVGKLVAFRLGQYAAVKGDVDYANQMVVLTKVPGIAREAQILRDRLRSLSVLTDSLRPR